MKRYLALMLLLLTAATGTANKDIIIPAGATGIVTIKLKNTSTAKGYLNVLEIREKL